MSSSLPTLPTNAPPAIELSGVGKCYAMYDRPQDRMLDLVAGRWRKRGKDFWALRDVSLSIGKGEVFGIVGRNGAGKSTLLQLVCGTVAPTTGNVAVRGRVAALLELGAGFNPEFTGRENVHLNAAVLGLTPSEIAAAFDSIVAFADIGAHLEQPVKTYSSGMAVRLAFAVAVHVDPEILIIDEALAVGDGAFAKKSFDRIMKFKDEGKTILFCSHTLFQVESVCNRVLWLDGGRARMMGDPGEVISAYTDYLGTPAESATAQVTGLPADAQAADPNRSAHLTSVLVSADGADWGRQTEARSGESDVSVQVRFNSNPSLPAPSLAVGFVTATGTIVNSSLSADQGAAIERDAAGRGAAVLTFPRVPLLGGNYAVAVYLMDERGIHIYDFADRAAEVKVRQQGRELGVVHLPSRWNTADADAVPGAGA
ncbi:ABC transporter ATP-binding protein [uncultured Xylophilus sp.]|uniref:ABC transporter ATP-binding protein n=1 Tax=uncultured Xylophilus sp. TaxID=296832 RepID=UPI0025E9D452|nr:ABC transporter ATP-binding protein [uncultured Xylophilus sp.]